MKLVQLSKKVGRSIVIPMSMAFLASVNPLRAQNTNESFSKPIQLAQQDLPEENDKLEKATKEAQEAIDAAGKAAQEEIDQAIREAEERLNQTTVALEQRANWGWLGLLGLLGLFGLAGKGKHSE